MIIPPLPPPSSLGASVVLPSGEGVPVLPPSVDEPPASVEASGAGATDDETSPRFLPRKIVLSRLTTSSSYSSSSPGVMLGCATALGLTPETLLGSSSTAFTTHTISSRQSRSLPMLTPPGTN
uniref:Uncharacterized protein n=1 Tax=Cacopsylla melanoneura TaxID=428564 RepID=A0A8D8TEY8_9HEMI